MSFFEAYFLLSLMFENPGTPTREILPRSHSHTLRLAPIRKNYALSFLRAALTCTQSALDLLTEIFAAG